MSGGSRVTPAVRRLGRQMLEALSAPVVCGQVTLNFNEGHVQSVEIREFFRVEKVDNLPDVVRTGS